MSLWAVNLFLILMLVNNIYHIMMTTLNIVFCVGYYCCNTCGKRFKYPTHFSTHKKWECQKEPRFRCPHCHYRSHVKNNVKKHIANVHGSVMASELLPFSASLQETLWKNLMTGMGSSKPSCNWFIIFLSFIFLNNKGRAFTVQLECTISFTYCTLYIEYTSIKI